jgi:hypothetical protein
LNRTQKEIDVETEKYQNYLIELIANSSSRADALDKFCAEESDPQMQELFLEVLRNYSSLKRNSLKARLLKTSLGNELF